MEMPAPFRPLRARPPASTKVRMSGPLSLRTRSTIAVSAHSARQSQFWPWISRPLAEREGRISAPVQPSPGSSSAAFSFGAGLGDHFGARVDHDHVFERHAGAGGDAAHFLQVVRRELLDLAREALDQPAARHGVVAQRDQGLAVHGGALADAVRRLLSIGRPRASGAPDTDTKGNCVIWVMGVGRRRAPRSLGKRMGFGKNINLFWRQKYQGLPSWRRAASRRQRKHQR